MTISGISPASTEDSLAAYFENAKRSGGGPIQEIVALDTDKGEAIITFVLREGILYD